MKTLLITILLLIAATTGRAQYLNSGQRAEVRKYISDSIKPLKAEIKWIRTAKTADSLKYLAAIKVLSDSLGKFKPLWINPLHFDAKKGLKVDSLNIKKP